MYDTPLLVAKNFIRCKCPYYLITDSKGSKLWWNDEESELEAAAELLKQDLEQIRKGNTGVYIIHHFKEVPKGGFKKGIEGDCISTFKKPLYDEYEREDYRQNYQSVLLNEIRGIGSRIDEIEKKQILLESQEDEDIENEVEPNGIFGQIMGNPHAREMVTNFMNAIAANLTSTFLTHQKPLTMAGINETQTTETEPQKISLEQILEKLFSLGVTANDLYILSQKSKLEISLLLKMLRK